jgi:hypothetical protein
MALAMGPMTATQTRPTDHRVPVQRDSAMGNRIIKLAIAGSFGIALLGLYTMFNSTNVQMSLSACAMYVVGTVVGVILTQSQA